MPLASGTHLGPYEIVDLLGVGGMGEVYRATDTRLRREVAVKVTAEQFTERFEREARVIASLNHPNICTLFDVGPNYLVMELIAGPTLGDRIREGAIPLEEAIPIARQIADALETAHDKGVVHRDLKPGNVKLTEGGVVKVLDFGLAKLAGPAPAPSENSPTLTVTMGSTMAGMILGTASYMAPEQAKGKTVDKRADIWAFGVVLHEMLTGQKLFERETLSETLASVLKEAPDLAAAPPQVRPLLKRCLEKDPKKRLRDIGDAMALLEAAAEAAAPTAAPAATALPPRLRWLWPGLAALFLMTTAAVSLVHFRETPPPVQPMLFTIPAPEKNTITSGLFAVSPNGRYVVFGARTADGLQRLWLRDLEEPAPKPLPGTDRSGVPIPFWSPDSRFVVFDDNGGKLKKLDVTGGVPEVLCDVPRGGSLGGSWNRDDVILFGSSKGVMRVPAAGGTPTAVTTVNASQEFDHMTPVFLPDGKHFLYYRLARTPQNTGLAEGTLDAQPAQQSSRLLLAATNPLLVPSADPDRGEVLFIRDGALRGQAFDNRRRELLGEPVTLVENIGFSYGGVLGRFSASRSGLLVYQAGLNPDSQLSWYDRNGRPLGTVGDPGRYGVLTLSRDGTKAGVDRTDPRDGNRDVWVIDLVAGTSSRLTFDPAEDGSPVFSPDASRVAFLSYRGGVFGLYAKAANGSGADETLLKPGPRALFDWSPDGRFLIYGLGSPSNIWVLPVTGDRKPFPFFKTQFTETPARLSPDGRFIGYRSDESGRNEIYVKAFTPAPDAGASAAKWVISRNGGIGMVHWRKDGKELYYLGTDGNVMAVEVSTTPTFHAGNPRALFEVPQAFLRVSATPGNLAAVAPDGQRFLFAMPVQQNDREEFSAILNWPEKLKR